MFTTFETGNQTYQLKFTTNALCEFESRYQIAVLKALQDEKTVYYLRGLLWAGLLWKNSKLTTAEAGNIIDDFFAEGKTFKELLQIVQEALKASGFFSTSGNEKKTAKQSEKKA